MFDVQPFLSLPIKTFVFSKPLVTNLDTKIYWRCKLPPFQAPNVNLHNWYRLLLHVTLIVTLFTRVSCTSSTVTCVALKMLRKVLKSHKVLLCKHSRHVPHAWASPHVSPNVQMYCCLKEEIIPIFSQYSNVLFSEKDRKVYLSCLLWSWLLLPVLIRVPLLGFTSTLVCVGGEAHMGHVNCKHYGFHSQPISTKGRRGTLCSLIMCL